MDGNIPFTRWVYVLGLSANLQLTPDNFFYTTAIAAKLGGCVSYAKIAPEPKRHAQEKSEFCELSFFVRFVHRAGGANLRGFVIFEWQNIAQIKNLNRVDLSALILARHVAIRPMYRAFTVKLQ